VVPNGVTTEERGPRDLDLIVVGDVNPDIVVAPGEPEYGQRERIVDAIDLTIGGSASIMAAGAVRLGLRVALVGVVGDDPFGRFMLGELGARGVDVASVRVDPGRPTGASVILARDGDRAILTSPGTIGTLVAADVPLVLLTRARHLHLASCFLLDGLLPELPTLIGAARRAGLTVSIDPNGDPTGSWDRGLRAALRSIDVFLPNDTEARLVAGVDDLVEAARALAGDQPEGGPLVVIKRGAAGAIAVGAGGESISVAGHPIVPVDAIGAGDAFDAAFLAAWLDDRPRSGPGLRRCLAVGVVAGALSTRGPGGTARQATRAEVDAALAAGGSE
jgi:sugar/nucleoside kinase (ribokinase family)